MNLEFMSELFGGRYRYQVLKQLFGDPNRTYHLRGLASELGVSSGTLLTMLKRMVRAGLVERVDAQPSPLYRASMHSPLAIDLVNMFHKDSAIVEAIRAALKPLAPSIRYAAIFGSYASASETNHSDIDVLVITDELPAIAVQAALATAEEVARRPVNASVYTTDAWFKLREEGSEFTRNVLASPRIKLTGTEDMLANRR